MKMSHLVRVEVARRRSDVTNEDLEKLLLELISDNLEEAIILPTQKLLKIGHLKCPVKPELKENVESLVIVDQLEESNTFKFFFYVVNTEDPDTEYLSTDKDAAEVEAGTHWLLPFHEFEGLYESLIYEKGLKEKFLSMVETTLLFSKKGVDQHIVACNRLALLYGPPGTGKTSLCKAIAQKLGIRMQKEYHFTHLIEINCHSLFSKWFSESGKLVMQLFGTILELIENPTSLVIVLIDEIESIAYSRTSVSSAESTDSLRVVNAVLTQLDKIRKYPNVLVMTTSNVTQCIDQAFLDRADVIQYIGPPIVEAIYDIYSQALHELRRVGILEAFSDLIPIDLLIEAENNEPLVHEVLNAARMSFGLSGRTIRKMAFLTHAQFQQKEKIDIMEFVVAMKDTILKQIAEKRNVNNMIEVTEDQYLNESQLIAMDPNSYNIVQLNGMTLNGH
ncbi:pachytene checkpoint protein 2 homolog [Culicoides brevitarsis]|uniref:pachytene checkpoint protein 2 homolog n=1 Tax=Culicoides brevitarsis TaxID=469753 RepID=UPI00307B7ABD